MNDAEGADVEGADGKNEGDGDVKMGTTTEAHLLSELFADSLEENGVMTYAELVEATELEDPSGSDVVQALESVAEIVSVAGKTFYVKRVGADDDYGKLRRVVVALFNQRGEDGSLKKSEIMKGADAAGLETVSNLLYLRVLKDVATAQKSIWTWKWGA
jgi:hypothetical protein